MLNARRPLCGFFKTFNSHLVSDGEDSTVCDQRDHSFFFFCSVETPSAVKSAVPWCMKPLSHSSTPKINASSLVLQSPCTRRKQKEKERMQWKNETDFKQKGDRVNESRGGKAKENETKWSKKRDRTKDIVCLGKCHTHTPPSFVTASKCPEARRATPRSILNTAKITSRQHSVTALEVSVGATRRLGSNSYRLPHKRNYMHTLTCDVCHWFCGGRHIHFISLLSSWTGLSICQPQSFLSKSIKLSCQINSAFLSSFPIWLLWESEVWWQETLCCISFFSSVAHLKWPAKNDTDNNRTDVF